MKRPQKKKAGGKNALLSSLEMRTDPGSILVFGNVTLDVICKTVDDVPRFDSIAFQDAAVTPGGCASNVAIDLARLGEKPLLVACLGDDQTADILDDAWKNQGVDARHVKRIPEQGTGVSVGLVDSDFQPRFIHTTGANAELTGEALAPAIFQEQQVDFMHIAGYFVLPGLLQPDFAEALARVQEAGVFISLDVVRSPAMKKPQPLWNILPHLDLFMCNLQEAEIMTGVADPAGAAGEFLEKGVPSVIIKLGAEGCWLADRSEQVHIAGIPAERVVDTTGAGDAFAAGLMFALRQGMSLEKACQFGAEQGGLTTGFLGAVRLD
jgi:sugar/nucleoside kinase (ribokinase family)